MATPDDHANPFYLHLIALLSLYELGQPSAPAPRYDGPATWYTNTISRSVEAIARRMFTAEEALKAVQAAQNSGPETKKRRSVGDSPPLSSLGSSNSSADLTNLTFATSKSDISAGQSPFFTPSNSTSSIPAVSKEADCLMASSTNEPSQNGGVRTPSPMTISLDGIVNPLENTRTYNSTSGVGPASAPPFYAEHVCCPSCGNTVTDGVAIARIAAIHGPPVSSPMIIPPGPLAAAAFESGMSAVEELRLLKAQVQDVAKVCNAVARGDLSQKITVPVQGVVMVQLKEVINGMVEKLGQFAKEVTRVSLEVGTEG
jgi:osomolarity two-component system, sensor histidine kinase NIK1